MQTIEEKLKKIVYETMCPVGHILLSANNVNPSTYIEGTTWVAWGSGRVPVGVDTSNSNFSTAEKTGGSATNSHTHTFKVERQVSHNLVSEVIAKNDDGTNGSIVGTTYGNYLNTNSALENYGESWNYSDGTYQTRRATTSSTSTSTLQPYITCYMWKRTA